MIIKHLKRLLIIVSIIIVCKVTANDRNSEIIKNEIKNSEDTTSTDTSNKLFEKLFKEKHVESKGLINIHKIEDKLYFEIPISLFGREMLLGSTVSETSDNGNVIVGSKPVAPILVNFSIENEKVLLNKVINNSITLSSDTNISNALDKNHMGAIMALFKVETYNPDSSAVVIDVTNFFKSDNQDLTTFDRSSKYASMGQQTNVFQQNNSFIKEFKSFEDNLFVRSTLSYNTTVKGRRGNLFTDKPYTVVATRSFLLLEENPYNFRIADYRIGVFNSGKVIFSGEKNKAKDLHFAHRWRLEPSDTAKYKKGEVVEPTKPIIFYMDSDFPEWWKPYIKEGIERWNVAYEAIGFKNAIKVIEFPKNDPEFDPENIKYSCIRYAPIKIENAMGPSWVDPRSGEIINASVYVYHDVIKLLNNWLFVQTSPANPRVRTPIIPNDILGDALAYVISHEVGHCLGFMHNMGASSVIPVDSLRSASFTQKHGTTTSIMDYARFNYVAQPGDLEKGVRLTPPKLGVYDYFLVKWLYTPLFENDPFKENKILANWITEKSGDKFYRYGKQQLFGSCDPTSQMEDLGDDPVKASIYGVKNLKYVIDNMNGWLKDSDPDYTYRTEIYQEAVNQHFRYMGHVATNVGGVIVNEKMVGDKLPHFEIVPKEKQRESLMFLFDQIYDLDWFENEDLLRNLPLRNSSKDLLRKRISEMIVSSARRVYFGSTKTDDPYTIQECLTNLYTVIFSSLRSRGTPSETDMILQKAFIDELIGASKISDNENNMVPSALSLENKDELLNRFQNDPPKGFELWVLFNYDMGANNENLFYGFIIKAEKDLNKRVRKCSEEAKLHYKLLIRKIEQARK